MLDNQPILEVRGLSKQFALADSEQTVQACMDVTLRVNQGETLGLVGESGSGKTTLGRCMIGLIPPSEGSVIFDGIDLTTLSTKELRGLRSRMQIVFQEPVESLNPRLSILRQVTDPLRIHEDLSKGERRARAAELLSQVGLPPAIGDAYPGSLSAGAAQRISIARSIATDPDLLILDEPTSALAPEDEAEIISLLVDLQEARGISYVFISHDLRLVSQVSDWLAVMYLSQVVETGPTPEVFATPRHPYTKALLGSTLFPEPGRREQWERQRIRLEGEIPSPIDLPSGCYLASRCPNRRSRCDDEPQTLLPISDDRNVRCWRVVEGDLEAPADSAN